jgi:hypothetical protein
MPFSEDLSTFFNTADFADVASLNSVAFNGILGKHYVTINDVETSAPSFTCIATDVSTVKHGDVLVVRGITYHVIGIHPDGTGIVVLILEQQ